MTPSYAGYHLPGFTGEVVSRRLAGVEILLPRLTPDQVRRVVDQVVERAHRVVPTYTVDDLAELFARVASHWLTPSPERSALCAAVAAVTGQSQAVVEASIATEQDNCRQEDMLAALDRDLGHRRCLDGFVADARLGNLTRALGPRLAGAVLTANVPGLSYLPMVRSLLVKSPLVAKLSSGEPLFGPAWLARLATLAPDLAQCVALFWWQGANAPLEEAMLERASVVMVYGGPQSVAHYRQTYGPSKQIIVHGHKIGVALVGREALADAASAGELARRLALDVAMYDQRACISPQVAFVERGGGLDTQAFAALVADGLAEQEGLMAQSPLSLDTAASLAQERRQAQFLAAQEAEAAVFIRELATVVHEPQAVFAGVLPVRFLRVCPVDDLAQALELMAPYGEYLQNAGLAVGPERLDTYREALARLGVSRLCDIGRMHKPTMRWKHDGLGPYAAMVRWVDVER